MAATTAATAIVAVETAFAAGVGLIGGLFGSGGFAAEEAFDPGDQAAAAGLLLFDGSRGVGDRRRGAGLFLEAARLAWRAFITRIAWLTGVARIAGLTWLARVAWITRLARFTTEFAARLRLRWLFGTWRFAAGGGAVLGGFGVALAMAFGAEDRTIAATVVARVLVVVGGLSAGE
jgi:hypothetical protein